MRTAPEFNWPAPSETRTTDSTITTADNGKVIDNRGATTTVTHTAADDLPEGFEISFINLSPVSLSATASQFWPPAPITGEYQIIFSPTETDIILSSAEFAITMSLGIGQSVTILETHHSIVKFKLIYQTDVNGIICNAWSCNATFGERAPAYYGGSTFGGVIPTTTQLRLKDLDPTIGILQADYIAIGAESTDFKFSIVQENTPDAIVGTQDNLGVYTDGAILAGPTNPAEKVYLEIQNDDSANHFRWPGPTVQYPGIFLLYTPNSDAMSNIISNASYMPVGIDEDSQIIVEASTTNTYWIDNVGNLYSRSIANGPVTSFEISVLNGYGMVEAEPPPTWENTKSVLFDGSDDAYLSDSDLTSTTSGTAYSISVWVKQPATVYSSIMVLTYGNIYLSPYHGNMTFYHVGSVAIDMSAARTTTGWQHWCAVVRADTSVSWYRDGVEVDTQASSTCPWAHSSKLGIGNDEALNSPFAGNIDDVGLYTTDLSATEVAEIYDGDGTRTAGPANLLDGPQAGSLWHYYRMGDDPSDSPTVMIDQVGYPGGIDMTGSGGCTIEEDVP